MPDAVVRCSELVDQIIPGRADRRHGRWHAGLRGQFMALWWLSFRTRYVPAGAAIVHATSLEHARMLAAIAGFDAGVTFTDGHALDGGQAAKVAESEIGRFLLPAEAGQVRGRIEGQS